MGNCSNFSFFSFSSFKNLSLKLGKDFFSLSLKVPLLCKLSLISSDFLGSLNELDEKKKEEIKKRAIKEKEMRDKQQREQYVTKRIALLKKEKKKRIKI